MNAKLLEIGQIGNTHFGILDIPRHFWPDPGQYLPCQNLSQDSQHLSTPLFKVYGPDEVLRLGPLYSRRGRDSSSHYLPGGWVY